MYWIKRIIGESILELHETNAMDESIKSYEYNEYQSITGTQPNSAGQITIAIENQDQFLHLHKSYLLTEGDVSKADNTRYADADLITLTNNGLLYLFSSLKLTLAGPWPTKRIVGHGWTNGGTCQLSWSGYIPSRFSELFINILQRMRTGTRLVSRYQH